MLSEIRGLDFKYYSFSLLLRVILPSGEHSTQYYCFVIMLLIPLIYTVYFLFALWLCGGSQLLRI